MSSGDHLADPPDEPVRCPTCRHPLKWVVKTFSYDGMFEAVGTFEECRFCRKNPELRDMS